MAADRLIRFLRFGLIGCLGFAVDAGIVFSLVYGLNASPLFSRFPAWLIAVSVTYAANLAFTFRDTKAFLPRKRSRIKRYLLYVSSQALGGGVNISTYLIVMTWLHSSIFIGLLSGTLVGLAFNFTGASLIVSKRSPQKTDTSSL